MSHPLINQIFGSVSKQSSLQTSSSSAYMDLNTSTSDRLSSFRLFPTLIIGGGSTMRQLPPYSIMAPRFISWKKVQAIKNAAALLLHQQFQEKLQETKGDA